MHEAPVIRRRKEVALPLFAFASLSPALVILIACWFGGLWALAALIYMTFCVALLDRAGRLAKIERRPISNPFGAELLLVVEVILHVLTLIAAVFTAPGHTLSTAVLLTLATGLFAGQVSHPAAHELIHAASRKLRRLGIFAYSSMLIGHHASAHRLVHHVHVATDLDPNSARGGEGFYRFVIRASVGSFIAGHEAEAKRHPSIQSHPYAGYLAIGLACLIFAFMLSGWAGVLVFTAISLYAQVQIYLADYVQHYGLRRQTLDGQTEPVGPAHSWNAPHWYSAAMMLNAPRHSDHHINPARSYPELTLDKSMPTLPSSLPVMAIFALWPPLWRRIMDPRVARWQRSSTNNVE